MTPPHSNPNEAEFLNQIRQQLAEHSTQLDPKTTERLYQARRKALAHYQRQAKPALVYAHKIPGAAWVLHGYEVANQHRQGMAVLGALAVVALLLVRLWQPGTASQPGLPPLANPHSALDLEILTAPENPEFYAELEFYTWLTTHDDEQTAP